MIEDVARHSEVLMNRFALTLGVVALVACGGRPTTGIPSDGGPGVEASPPGDGRPDTRPPDARRDTPWWPPDTPWVPDFTKPDKPKPVDGPTVWEAVTCVFNGPAVMNECVSSQGYGCSGVGKCTAKVGGPFGAKLLWKSSCGASAPSTVIDGKDEVINFSCPSTAVVETVTCVFAGSSKVEECYSSKGPSCKGVGSCSVTVSGTLGEKVDWKTSCGGYYTTILDGKNESIQVSCGTTPVSESMTCVFQGATGMQTCSSYKGSCSGVGSCVVTVSGTLYEKVDWKATCGTSLYTQILDGMPEKATFSCMPSLSETVTCLFPGSKNMQECTSSKGSCMGITSCSLAVKGTLGEKVDWKSTCGGYATTIIDGKSESITFSCITPPPPPASEWVTCLFKGSTTYQECYSSKGSCKGLLGCTVFVSGTLGEKVEWKSTCGGYAYTVIDNQPEPASFICGGSPDAGIIFPDGGPPPLPDGWWP